MYLAQKKPESGLWPADSQGQAKVQQWLNWVGNHWGPAIRPFFVERILKARLGLGGPDEAELAKANEAFPKVADVFEGQLKNHQYLVGAQLTIADFSLASAAPYRGIAEVPLENYPGIKSYCERVTSTEAWKKAIPAM